MTDSLFDDLPAAVLIQLNAVCDRFEGTWSPESLETIRSIVTAFDPHQRNVVIVELIALDAESRSANRMDVPATEYARLFPEIEPAMIAQLATAASGSLLPAKRAPESPSTDTPKLSSIRKQLLAAELCTDSEVTQIIELLPDDDDGPTLVVQALRNKSRITSFQADVLAGENSGPLLLGDYVLLEQLGSGGMGRAYKAFHRRMHRVVAVKLLNSELQNEDRFRTLFQQEFIATGQLTHPNIVTAFDAGEADGELFLVTEYVDGRDISRVLKEDGPLDIATARSVVLQTAKALAHVHERGVVHRDVKPGNLMLKRDGTVKLLDLGLSKLAPELNAATGGKAVSDRFVMGTAAYMSPEQATDTRKVDHRSDIYSLGCTFFTLLTGKPCYPADSAVASALAHRNEPIPSLTEVCPGIPSEWDLIFRRMVAKKPDDRFQSMSDVHFALVEASASTSHALSRPLVLAAVCVVLLVAAMLAFYRPSGLEESKENTTSVALTEKLDTEELVAQPDHSLAVAPFSAKEARAFQELWARRLDVEVEYHDPATRLRFVLIPPGRFRMGSSAKEVANALATVPYIEDPGRAGIESESPLREVSIERPFYLSTCEVTVGQFRRFVDASGYVTTAETNPDIGHGYRDGRWGQSGGHFHWQHLGDVKASVSHPVPNMTRVDAEAFCTHYSLPDDEICYRLPTESEWEFACRAGSESRFSFGDDDSRLAEFATVSKRARHSRSAMTVGTHRPNAFGLFDMHGNVAEWCSGVFDWRNESLEQRMLEAFPDFRDRATVGVVRGGSVGSPVAFMRSASRQAGVISNQCESFRVVLEIRSPGR